MALRLLEHTPAFLPSHSSPSIQPCRKAHAREASRAAPFPGGPWIIEEAQKHGTLKSSKVPIYSAMWVPTNECCCRQAHLTYSFLAGRRRSLRAAFLGKHLETQLGFVGQRTMMVYNLLNDFESVNSSNSRRRSLPLGPMRKHIRTPSEPFLLRAARREQHGVPPSPADATSIDRLN